MVFLWPTLLWLLLAVPLLVMIGRESVAQGSVDDELLLEAESLAGVAMTP